MGNGGEPFAPLPVPRGTAFFFIKSPKYPPFPAKGALTGRMIVVTLFKKVDHFFDRLLTYLSAAAFISMLFCVLVQVVARFIPAWSPSWTEELTRLFFEYAMCIGAPLSMKYKQYVNLDSVPGLFKPRGREILYGIVYLLIAVFCLITATQSIPFVQLGLRTKSSGLRIPMIVSYVTVAFAMFACTVYALINAIKYFFGLSDQLEEEEG